MFCFHFYYMWRHDSVISEIQSRNDNRSQEIPGHVLLFHAVAQLTVSPRPFALSINQSWGGTKREEFEGRGSDRLWPQKRPKHHRRSKRWISGIERRDVNVDAITVVLVIFSFHTREHGGTRWCSCLRHYAANRKVVGSIPDGVIGIFSLT